MSFGGHEEDGCPSVFRQKLCKSVEIRRKTVISAEGTTFSNRRNLHVKCLTYLTDSNLDILALILGVESLRRDDCTHHFRLHVEKFLPQRSFDVRSSQSHLSVEHRHPLVINGLFEISDSSSQRRSGGVS